MPIMVHLFIGSWKFLKYQIKCEDTEIYFYNFSVISYSIVYLLIFIK